MPIARSLKLQLFLVGFFLIFVGIVLIMASSISNGGLSGGIVIIVGPIPIIIGTDSYSIVAILLATVLTILSFVLFFLVRHREN